MHDFNEMTRDQIIELYNANIAERKRLIRENNELELLLQNAASSRRQSKAEIKLAALQAKLNALASPTVDDPVDDRGCLK